MKTHLFTSESVTVGHPDKLCDQISDALLDAYLEKDATSKVAVEAAVKDNTVFVFGEVTSNTHVDVESIVRNLIARIGYTDPTLGFSANSCHLQTHLSQQSANIAGGVHKSDGSLGAGDQGLMFGYADTQTPNYMPLPITLAHQLTARLQHVREQGTLPYLRPDGKAQVTIEYNNFTPVRIDTIVISTQHSEDTSPNQLKEDIRNHVILPTMPSDLIDETLTTHINPAGPFIIGGPVGDSGLTGRKIIVDTYGGWSRHGGGAFSGKDSSKVDRSGAYAARQAAKSIVALGLADRCEVQLAYAIGVPKPVSIHVTTFSTGKVPDHEIAHLLTSIDFSPSAMIARLNLTTPQFLSTARNGHFGHPNFTWEQPLKLPVPA